MASIRRRREEHLTSIAARWSQGQAMENTSDRIRSLRAERREVISGPGARGRAPAPPSIAGTSSPEVAATYRYRIFHLSCSRR